MPMSLLRGENSGEPSSRVSGGILRPAFQLRTSSEVARNRSMQYTFLHRVETGGNQTCDPTHGRSPGRGLQPQVWNPRWVKSVDDEDPLC